MFLHCSTLIATEYVNTSVKGIENIVKHILHRYRFSSNLEQFQYKTNYGRMKIYALVYNNFWYSSFYSEIEEVTS